MTKQIIQTEAAPKAIGTYSQGVVYQGTLYTSGQIALDPETGRLMSKDAEKQIRQVFRNLAAITKPLTALWPNFLTRLIRRGRHCKSRPCRGMRWWKWMPSLPWKNNRVFPALPIAFRRTGNVPCN